MLWNILAVGVGSAVGGILRYITSQIVSTYNGTGFPFATFVVNLLGCLLIGILSGYILKNGLNESLRLLAVVGFCGGYTTFSTFANENLQLLQNGNYLFATIYTLASIILGVALVAFGYYITR